MIKRTGWKARRWTKGEEIYLKNNYLIKDYHKIAKKLNRKYSGVNMKRKKMGLIKKGSGSNVKKPTCKIVKKEIAIYFAGLFDGEGTIQLSNKGKLNCRFAIGMINKDIMDWLKEVFNCGIVYTNKANITMWAVNTIEDLKILLPQVIPYMKVKQERAKVLLEILNNHKRGKRVTKK